MYRDFSNDSSGGATAQQQQQPRIADLFTPMAMQQHGGGVALTQDMRAGNEALRQEQLLHQMQIQQQNQGCPETARVRAGQQMAQQPQI